MHVVYRLFSEHSSDLSNYRYGYDNNTVENTRYYIHTDHLGSYCTLTNAAKQVVQRNFFDPWGNTIALLRGLPPDDPQQQPTLNFTLTPRGFTGHEHYPQFTIINMNGRLYDPVIGRFFSPDKYVANSSFTQDFNRYSYARNCPLMYTDPDGEFVWLAPLIVGIVMGAVQGAMQGVMIATQKGAIGGEFAKYFFSGMGIGMGIGALSGLAGGALSGALSAVRVGGFVGGAIAGGVIGLPAGALNGLAMGALAGKKSNDLLESTGCGALMGFGTGVVMGGIMGAAIAGLDGKNIWLGEDIAMGRNAWSFNNTDKPAKYFFTEIKNYPNVYRIDAWSKYMKSIAEKDLSNYQTVKSRLENWVGKGMQQKRIYVGEMKGRGFLDYSGYVELNCNLQISFDGNNVLNLSPGYYSSTRLIIPSGTQYIDIKLNGTPYYYDFDNWPTVPFKSIIQGVWKF